MKKCKYCFKNKQLNEFPKHSGHRDGHAAICKQCKKKKYPTTAEQKQRAYERNIKRNYGITVNDYNSMYENQGGLCLGCKRGNNGSRFHIDHCHTTGKVRGLLCNNCNRGLGLLGDSIVNLEKAISYLNND